MYCRKLTHHGGIDAGLETDRGDDPPGCGRCRQLHGRRRRSVEGQPGAPSLARRFGLSARVVQTAINSTSERYGKLLPLTILEPL